MPGFIAIPPNTSYLNVSAHSLFGVRQACVLKDVSSLPFPQLLTIRYDPVATEGIEWLEGNYNIAFLLWVGTGLFAILLCRMRLMHSLVTILPAGFVLHVTFIASRSSLGIADDSIVRFWIPHAFFVGLLYLLIAAAWSLERNDREIFLYTRKIFSSLNRVRKERNEAVETVELIGELHAGQLVTDKDALKAYRRQQTMLHGVFNADAVNRIVALQERMNDSFLRQAVAPGCSGGEDAHGEGSGGKQKSGSLRRREDSLEASFAEMKRVAADESARLAALYQEYLEHFQFIADRWVRVARIKSFRDERRSVQTQIPSWFTGDDNVPSANSKLGPGGTAGDDCLNFLMLAASALLPGFTVALQRLVRRFNETSCSGGDLEELGLSKEKWPKFLDEEDFPVFDHEGFTGTAGKGGASSASLRVGPPKELPAGPAQAGHGLQRQARPASGAGRGPAPCDGGVSGPVRAGGVLRGTAEEQGL